MKPRLQTTCIITCLFAFALASTSARGATIAGEASNPPSSFRGGALSLDLYRRALRPTGALAIESFPVGEVCVVMPRTGSPNQPGGSSRLALYAYSHVFWRWMPIEPPTPLTLDGVCEALSQAEAQEREQIAARRIPPWQQTPFGAPVTRFPDTRHAYWWY